SRAPGVSPWPTGSRQNRLPRSSGATTTTEPPARNAAMPDRYAVIGNPVAHSKSPQIHTEFARQTGQDIIYVRLPAPRRGFRKELDRFIAHGGKGMNVTVPFKQEAAAACTSISERARFAQ